MTADIESRGSILAGKEAADSDPLDRLADELRGGLASIRDGVSEAMTAMNRRIDELKGGQEDLSDRVLYGQADAVGTQRTSRPLASLVGVQADALALFLSNERPQLSALILSFVDDALGARVLSLLPESMQVDTARRVATMDWVSPGVLAIVEQGLSRTLASVEKTDLEAGGVQKIVGMLNLVSRRTEKHVIGALDDSDPGLAEAIKRSMFVFEDIAILDDESISAVLERADERDILIAMKPVAEELRERLFGRFPADKRERMRIAFADLGRIRLSECDAAGIRVVEVIRGLEEEGRIVISRKDA